MAELTDEQIDTIIAGVMNGCWREYDHEDVRNIVRASLALSATGAEDAEWWSLHFSDPLDFCLAASPWIGAAYGDADEAAERINTSPWGQRSFGKVSATAARTQSNGAAGGGEVSHGE